MTFLLDFDKIGNLDWRCGEKRGQLRVPVFSRIRVLFTVNMLLGIEVRNDICSVGSLLGGLIVGSSLCNLSAVKRICITDVCRLFLQRKY